MALGFPIQLISKLRCTSDGATLELGLNCQLSEDGGFIRHGSLHCCNCAATFTIDDGILNILNHVALDDESKLEQQLRNERAIRSANASKAAWYENEYSSTELIPTLNALSAGQGQTILELGCGDGRYTVLLADQCQWVLAVDFSLESLRILQLRLEDTRNVALVHGDITTMKVGAESFDRVLSTLVSNLPTREHRNGMYRLAGDALKLSGRFVFSTHHHGFWQMLRGEAKSGRYELSGIYRYNFTVSECTAEARRYFESIKARPIQIYLPLARRLRLPLVTLSRFLEPIPLINKLGELILCTAERPIRDNLGEAKTKAG